MAEAEFVIEAVQLVAQHGWKLLPLYSFNPETGEFHHHANHVRSGTELYYPHVV